MLFFPAFWQPMMPHLALPALTAALRASGHQVVQRDLNIETFDFLLSRANLDLVTRRLPQDRKRIKKANEGKAGLRQALNLMDWGLNEGAKLVERVESAKRIVRSAAFFDGERGLAALATLSDALRLACLPYFPAELTLTGFNSPYPADSSAGILAAARDRTVNPFVPYYEQRVLPDIRRERPDVIGISITCQHQVIAAFTLAQAIRDAGLKTHVVMGGKMVTCWRDILDRRPSLFTLADSMVYDEGEAPLLALLDALQNGRPLASVPNLIYRDGAELRRTEPAPWQNVAALLAPDFDGLPLDLYLSPERVLPVSASRGCYWRRCAFCNVGYGESHAFRERPGAQVAAEIIALSERYGVRRFFFADEALSPRMFRALSPRLAGAGLTWTCCARFDAGISAELLRNMHAGGCRMLLYGLEAGSQRVLSIIGKGTSLPVAERILRDGAQTGIWNHTFVFFGFPGETAEEAAETAAFIYRNAGQIHSICTGTFLLEKYATVADDPEHFGVNIVRPPAGHDLAFYYDYGVTSGMTSEQAANFENAFIDTLPARRFAQFYFHDTYRFLYASYLSGQAPMPSLAEAGVAPLPNG
jgi:anaerobic magnesium-protoporphyrin IX monomethyl ester cyclase